MISILMRVSLSKLRKKTIATTRERDTETETERQRLRNTEILFNKAIAPFEGVWETERERRGRELHMRTHTFTHAQLQFCGRLQWKHQREWGEKGAYIFNSTFTDMRGLNRQPCKFINQVWFHVFLSFTLSVKRSHSPFMQMLWMVWPVWLKWLATGVIL